MVVYILRAWNVFVGMCSLGSIRSWFGGRRLILRCVFFFSIIKYRIRIFFF